MFKNITIGVLTIFVLLGCSSDDKSKSNRSFNEVERDIIHKYMNKFPNNVQISIAKIEDADVYYYGAVNQNKNVVTIDNQSSGFMIGSISKVFTSTLLAQLVLDGKVTLDENIAEKLPFPLHNDISISYKQLANHTSGIDDSDTIRYLKNDLVVWNRQGMFNYSNIGVSILGYMLTHIENRSYEKLLQERIFSKLSMDKSTTIRGDNLVPAIANDEPIPPMFESAGGIISTVEDLYQFALATFDDNPEYLLTQKATFELDDITTIGLGWFIEKDNNRGLNFLRHDGDTDGYRSSMILDKDNQNGIIILSNLPDGNNIFIRNLAEELMKEIYK